MLNYGGKVNRSRVKSSYAALTLISLGELLLPSTFAARSGRVQI